MDMIFNYIFGVVGFILIGAWTGFEFRSFINFYKILDDSINGRVNSLMQSKYNEKVINLDDFRQL